MSTPKSTPASPVLIICATIVAVSAIGALAALMALGADPSAIAQYVGLVGLLVTSVVGLGRAERIKETVDDLANGKMDAKIRAAVAEVIRDEHIDPAAREQLAADFERRDGGH